MAMVDESSRALFLGSQARAGPCADTFFANTCHLSYNCMDLDLYLAILLKPTSHGGCTNREKEAPCLWGTMPARQATHDHLAEGFR